MEYTTRQPSGVGVRSSGARRWISDMLNAWHDRPEPFKPYDYGRSRTRWARWTFVGFAAAGTIALALVVANNDPPAASSSIGAADVNAALSRPLDAAAGPVVEPSPALAQVLPPQAPKPMDAERPGLAEMPSQAPRRVVTTAPSGANMRTTPSLSGTVLWKAPIGTSLQVIGEEGNWLRVATPVGERAGWMHRSVVGN